MRTRKREMRDRENVLSALAMIGQPARPKMAKPKKRLVRDVMVRLMRKRGWGHKTPRDGVRRRLYSLAIERHQWWDWGHRLMILTGSDMGGNWDEPEPPMWWYRPIGNKHMWRTRYPRTVYGVVDSYDEFRTLTDGLNEDEMYRWKAMGFGQDGELHLGHRYWGKEFYGLDHQETRLLRRYLRMCHRHNWWGARPWLYSQGLHAAVHRKKPRTCQVTPPRGSGGYDHWHCDQKRRHKGDHRYQNYTWPGGTAHVEYAPRESA